MVEIDSKQFIHLVDSAIDALDRKEYDLAKGYLVNFKNSVELVAHGKSDKSKA